MAYDDLPGTAPLDGGRDAAPRSVTAFFDTEEAAAKASDDLVAAGVPGSDVRLAGGRAVGAEPPHPHGFWESLKEFFLPDQDRHLYAEALRRGGYALSVRTDTAAYGRVIEILDRDGAVDMDERSADWRTEGWTGLAGPAALGEREMAYEPAGNGTGGFAASRADQQLFDGPMDTASIEPGSVVPNEERPDRAAAGAPDTAYAAAMPGLGATARETTAMPGQSQPAPTRDFSHGRTRVRSYTGDLSGDGLPRE